MSQCKGRTHVTDVWTPPDQMLVLLPVRKQRRRCVYLAEMRTLSLRHWDAAADRDAALRPQSSLSAVRLLSSSALSNAGTAMMGQPPALPVLLLLEFLPPHNVLPFFRSPSGHFSLLSSLQKYGSNTSGPTADRFDLLTRDNNLHIYCQRT